MKWSTKIPKESGYYWVKLFSKEAEPQIIYYGNLGIVQRIGTSKTDVSTYYDVKAWSDKPIESPE